MSRRRAHATKEFANLHRVRGTALAFVHGVATRVLGGVDHVVTLTYGVVFAHERNKDVGSFWGH